MDVRLSVPSVAIPYGQRFIKVQLTTGDKLVNLVPRGNGDWTDANIGGSLNYDGMLKSLELYINNIFVNPEVHNIFIKRIGFTLIRVHRNQTINADQSNAEILLNQLKWPIESLAIGMKMKDYNSSDVALRRQHLDKWHTFCLNTPTTRAQQGWRVGQKTLKNAAYTLPTSVLNLAAAATNQLRLTPTANLSAGSNAFEGITNGDLLTLVLNVTPSNGPPSAVTVNLEVSKVVPDCDTTTKGYLEFKQQVGPIAVLLAQTTALTLTGAVVVVNTPISSHLTSTVLVQTNTLDTVTIKAHGIPIYNGFGSKFYNAYIPYHYGGQHVTVPKDIGALFIPFNLYPGTYQPSGHNILCQGLKINSLVSLLTLQTIMRFICK